MGKPPEIYNGMIAPLIHTPSRGAIWYQGESQMRGVHGQYRTLFADYGQNGEPIGAA